MRSLSIQGMIQLPLRMRQVRTPSRLRIDQSLRLNTPITLANILGDRDKANKTSITKNHEPRVSSTIASTTKTAIITRRNVSSGKYPVAWSSLIDNFSLDDLHNLIKSKTRSTRINTSRICNSNIQQEICLIAAIGKELCIDLSRIKTRHRSTIKAQTADRHD